MQVLRAFEMGYCHPPPPGCPRNIYKLMVDCWWVQQWLACSNSKETTQHRRKVTWEQRLTIEPRTRDLRSNAEFQPHKLQNRPRSLVPHRHLCASHGCAESTTAKDVTSRLALVCWMVVSLQAWGGWCNSSTTIQRRSPVRGLVVSPFPHVAFLLSCVLSLELRTSSQSTHPYAYSG